MVAQEAVKYSGLSAASPVFSLSLGGYYNVAAHGTWGGGNVHLQQLLPDNSTFIDVGTSTNFTADGAAIVLLAPGAYKFTVTTATAVAVAVARVPLG